MEKKKKVSRGDKVKHKDTINQCTTRGIFNLIKQAADREIKISLILFPRMVEDPEYCYRALDFPNISYEDFKKAHSSLADEKMIHFK